MFRLRPTSLMVPAVLAACATTAPPPAVTPIRQLTLGQEANDRLARDAPRLAGNRPYHTWVFNATAGQHILIEMMSPSLDTHVILQDATGTELARDDDSGEGTNSRLRYMIRGTGQYRIVANSYLANRFGPYTLRLTEMGAITTSMTGVRGSVYRGETKSGLLATGDPVTTRISAISITRDARGRIATTRITSREVEFHAWLYNAQAGEIVTVELRSVQLDPLLIIQEGDGTELATNDDGGGGLNSRLVYTFPYAGVFRIVAATAAGVRTGQYALTVN